MANKPDKFAAGARIDPEDEKLKRERELDDLRAVITTPEGRRVMWRLLSRCGTFASIWEPSAKIHYNSGQQDVGHYLMAEIVEAEPSALLEMMKAKK
jgi:hypothetical protein